MPPIADGTQQFDALETLPKGLDGVYREFLRTRFVGSDIHQWRTRYRPLLGILTAAKASLKAEQLGLFTGLRGQELDDALIDLQQFLDPVRFKQGEYQLYHQSVIDFLSNKEYAKEFWIDLISFHLQIATCYLEQYVPHWHNCDLYSLRYLPIHLIEAKRWEELELILTDLGFIEAKCAAGMTYDLVRDYTVALNALPEAQEEVEKEQKHQARIKKYINDLIAYASGATPSLEVIPSVRPWTDEEVQEDTKRIISNPSRLDRLRVFSNFVNTESHGLAKYSSLPGYCIQQAYNCANSGPVATSAERLVNANKHNMQLLKFSDRRNEFNPHLALLKTFEHSEKVNCGRITPDGKIAVSGTVDGTLWVWDVEHGNLIWTVKAHQKEITCVSVTPDGKMAVSGSHDKTVCLWDLESRKCKKVFHHNEGIICVTITSDGKRCVSGVDRPPTPHLGPFESLNKDEIAYYNSYTLQIWDLETGKCVNTIQMESVRPIDVTPDGKFAVSPKSLYEKFKGVVGIPDTKKAVTLKDSSKSIVQFWNLESGECIDTQFGVPQAPEREVVAITPDGSIAISGSHERFRRELITLWDLKNRLKTFAVHRGDINDVDITPDGKKAISASNDKTVRVWDLERGGSFVPPKPHPNQSEFVGITLDGKKAVSAGDVSHAVRVWDLETGEHLRSFWHDYNLSDANTRLAADGKVVIGRGWHVNIWDYENDLWLKTTQQHYRDIKSLDVTPDGKIAITGSKDGLLRLWDIRNGKCLGTLGEFIEEDIYTVYSACVTPDGKKVVSGGRDDSIKVWDIDSKNCLKTIKVDYIVHGLHVTPDGKIAISYGKGNIHLWGLESGTCLRKIKVFHDEHFVDICILPSGRVAISYSYWDCSIQFWDLATGACIKTLEGHKGDISSVRVHLMVR